MNLTKRINLKKPVPCKVPGYVPPPTSLDFQQKPVPIARPFGTVIAADSRGPVELIRQGKGRYAVIYGLEVTRGLDRETAARKFGECIFHLCECEGLLD